MQADSGANFPAHHPQRGFTLLEVLVAFAILALAASLAYEGGGGAVGASARALRYQQALSLAKSHLAEIGRGAAIAEQEQSFADGDGFSCTLRIRPAARRSLTLSDNDTANDVQQATAILFDIEVTEHWRDGLNERSLRLQTRRFEVRTEGSAPG